MIIQYLGHSCFRLKGKQTTLITDPYDKSIGFGLPKLSGEIVTVSHAHSDHNAVERVAGSAKRAEPYVISAPGEYEVMEVGVFGWGSFHDDQQGALRGKNTIYTILMDGVRIVHLGDLGHAIEKDLEEDMGTVDVLLIPVGGVYTIGPELAVEIVNQLQPQIVIPMHYKTDTHNQATYGEMVRVEVFLKAMGAEGVEAVDQVSITANEQSEDTRVVWLQPKVS